jgi:hypothetical protein
VRAGPPILHGLALAVITVAAILVGYAVYRIVGLESQVAVQVLVAGVACVGAFALWGFAADRMSGGRLSLTSLRELGLAYAAAFIWLPLVLAPLHYVTQGYVTAPGNVLMVWVFQLPFNLLALMVANGRLIMDEVERS